MRMSHVLRPAFQDVSPRRRRGRDAASCEAKPACSAVRGGASQAMTIEQLVRAMLARSLPERIAGEAADDLFDDHRRLRETRGTFSAALFLIREARVPDRRIRRGGDVAIRQIRGDASPRPGSRSAGGDETSGIEPGRDPDAGRRTRGGRHLVGARIDAAVPAHQHSLSGRGPSPGLIRSRRPHAARVFGSRARTRSRQHGRRCEHRGGEPSAGGAARWRHRHADAGRSRGRPLLRHDRPRRGGRPAARRRRRRCRRAAGGRDQRRALAGSLWPPGLGAGRRDSVERPRLHDCGYHGQQEHQQLPGRQRRRLDHPRACGRNARSVLAHQSRQSMVDDSRACRRGGHGESGRGARARHRRSRDAAAGPVARAQVDHGARNRDGRLATQLRRSRSRSC